MEKIVLVDDEPDISATMKLFFTHKLKEYEIIAFTNSVEALHYIEQNKIVALVTDINMPDLDGLQLIRNLRAQNIKPLVFVVSGYYSNQNKEEFADLGELDFSTKPISLKVLAEKVKTRLEGTTK